ncbi:MAG: hypothetical protein ACE15E_22250 [Acidobacteriota bacterium]
MYRLNHVLLSGLLVGLVGCASNPPDYDFIATFDSGQILPDASNFETPTGRSAFILNEVTVGTEKRKAIVTLAGAKLAFSIPSVPRDARLTFNAGMGVDRGDGAEGVITIEADGRSEVVYRKFLNPVERIEDRRWFEESVSLSKFAGKQIKIIFSTNAGAKGDAIFDWFAWADPRLQ